MSRRGRKNADDAVLLALACGATVAQAAHRAGVSERTVYRRVKDPAFAEKLQATRAELVQRACGLLTAGSLEAVRALVELLRPDSPPNARLGAARATLEMGQKLREATEFEARLRAVEQRSADQGPQARAA